MNHNNLLLTFNQETDFAENQVNKHELSLFDSNLRRISNNLQYVNDYYVPQYEHPPENHPKVKENEVKPIKEHRRVHFCNEFNKIILNEIESIRKTQVQQILNEKVDIWKQKREECTVKNTNREPGRSERLAIAKFHTKELLDTNCDQLKIKILEEQKKSEQKARSTKFSSLLKIGTSLLNAVHKYKNDMIPQLLATYTVLEAEIIKLNNITQNCSTYDVLTLNKTVKIIKMFHEEFMKCVSIAENNTLLSYDNGKNEKDTPVKIVDIKIDANKESNNNLKNNNFNTNQESNKVIKTEVDNSSVKINKDNEFFTFKFKTKENIANTDISNFSFKTENNKIMNNTNKHFENEYKEVLENYVAIQKYLKNYESLYISFLQDDNLKPLKQELIKAINTPVNCISSVSPWHMKDKFEKLNALLINKTVKTGNSSVSTNSHQSALIFCKDTLAKKIINIGEQVVCVKTETAFEVASVITKLWIVHPDFGILLYARFKQKCPCLIPLNTVRTKEETDEQYYKLLGYNYMDGIVEKQDKYVKRMTGIIRLFSAFVVTETKSGKALGIGQAWMIIGATLNLIPQLDITAILLHEMLLITGYHLKKAYNKQFIKILLYIDSVYMKKIDEVTPVGCGGPVQRLKTFVSKAIEVGYINKPKGILPYDFW